MIEEWVASPVGDAEAAKRPVSVPGRPAGLAGEPAVRYKVRFADPRDPADDVVLLELGGLYAHATVEATGDRLDGDWPVEHDAYFEPLRLAVRPCEQNELVVTCREPQDRFGGLHDTQILPETDRVPGIWWDCSLDSRPLPTVLKFDVRPELTADGGTLHTAATVLTGGAYSGRITYSVRTGSDANTRGMIERASVDVDSAGRHVVEHDVDVRDPTLWWPRELGRQHSYTVRAKLEEETDTVTTGFCTTSVEGGELLVNGEPLGVRGVNLTTASSDDIDRAVEVNANLVRAHAQVLPPSVYEACDERGLLVWQDLPLTGPGAFDTDRAVDLAARLAGYCCSHPSVGAFAVHDDPSTALAGGLGSGLVDRLRRRWQAWRTAYDTTAAETVAGALPDGYPVFPAVGPPGVATTAGSYYPGWDYGTPDDIGGLLDKYPVDIVAEYGAASLGSEAVDGGTEVAGFDSEKHRRYAGTDPADSQAYQGTLLQTISESLRRRGTGAVAFALRDTDDAGMGVYTRDGEPKDSKERLERAFAPLQGFLSDPGPGRSAVVVVNDTPSGYAPTLEWTAGDDGGSLDLNVDAHAQWQGGPVSVPANATSATLALRIDDYEVVNEYEF